MELLSLQLCHRLSGATRHGEDEEEGVEGKEDGAETPDVAQLGGDHEEGVVGEEVGGYEPGGLVEGGEGAGDAEEGGGYDGGVHGGDEEAEP